MCAWGFNDDAKLAEDVVWVCQRLDQRRFVANHDGNVSVRRSDGLFWATPTARGKGELALEDLIIVDDEGKTVGGANAKIFSEWKAHRAIYDACPDALCVVHAHPPRVTALGLQERPLFIDMLPEAVISLGSEVPCVPSLPPLSSAQLKLIARAAQQSFAVLVTGNGIFASGHCLRTTYFRIELAEHLADITAAIPEKADVRRLSEEVMKDCLAKHQNFRAGLQAQVAEARATLTRSENMTLEDVVNEVMNRLDQAPGSLGHV